MNRGLLLLALVVQLLLSPAASYGQQRYLVRGLVLRVDRAHQKMLVSCQEIPGYMDAMVMSFKVADPKSLDGLASGAQIQFTLVVTKEASHAEDVRIVGYTSAEREPSKSRRLKTLDEALGGPGSPALSVGQAVPDFVLTDQNKRRVRLSDFAGKVVALNFVYTRCALPDYCYRLSNNFGALQKRYKDLMGRELILLTVTFDPVHDQPEILSEYAGIWKADPDNWRFLTGPAAEVQRVCDLFGVNFVQDEGLFVHSLHTAVIGRDRNLVANLEGNEFTPQQLGDLVGAVLETSK
ncbi:MAG TPA: SCO family protein [Terriglobales bacterium]|nr:SCO family protein [Terriglobales bacterium]